MILKGGIVEQQLTLPEFQQSSFRGDIGAFLERTEMRRCAVGAQLEPVSRTRFGQYFTPLPAAALIAGMAHLPVSGTLRVLDLGAGVGSLSAVLVARIVRERPDLHVDLTAIDVDPQLRFHLGVTLRECEALASERGASVTARAVTGDLFEMAVADELPTVDLVIMNPPYRKIGTQSTERRLLSSLGIAVSNLYSGFMALGVRALAPGGQMVAITPRSFTNGPYFGPFRRYLLDRVSLDQIHVFESRSTVFADSDVLQENVIFSAVRDRAVDHVVLSTSRGHSDDILARTVPVREVVKPTDSHRFIHIPSTERDTQVAEFFSVLPATLADIGIQVSTGRVVDFRVREHLLPEPTADAVPLIYPGNFRDGRICWPNPSYKAQALALRERTQKLILPDERYVLVKRFSAKEERRRVVAAVYESQKPYGAGVGFENHLNVFHRGGRGLDRELAQGLCLWLNSSLVDQFFRTFSGHTQVNATDLRVMRFPSRDQLHQLGTAFDGTCRSEEKIDALVLEHVAR